MAKPNQRELESFAGETVIDLKDMIRAATKYIDKGVKYVLVSLGAEGAVLTDGTDSYFCKSASVAVNSTVGAGDSMVSAVCMGIEKGVNITDGGANYYNMCVDGSGIAVVADSFAALEQRIEKEKANG